MLLMSCRFAIKSRIWFIVIDDDLEIHLMISRPPLATCNSWPTETWRSWTVSTRQPHSSHQPFTTSTIPAALQLSCATLTTLSRSSTTTFACSNHITPPPLSAWPYLTIKSTSLRTSTATCTSSRGVSSLTWSWQRRWRGISSIWRSLWACLVMKSSPKM